MAHTRLRSLITLVAFMLLGTSFAALAQGANAGGKAQPAFSEAFEQSLQLDGNGEAAGKARQRLTELSSRAAPNAGSVQPAVAAGPRAGTELKDCDACPAMIVVPAGEFIMGSPPGESGRSDDEGPAHIVRIARPFAVGKYEVTFDEWDACAAGRQCGAASDEGWGRGKRPVINVSYEQAVGFTEWLSEKTGKKYRLLTEAEWEYVARAGSDKARFWGISQDRACDFANVFDETGKRKTSYNSETFQCNDRFAETAPVGSFKPNAFGLYDILGNVWEWVQDCYNTTYDGAPGDGRAWSTGDCSKRVTRGGSWGSYPRDVRSAVRQGAGLAFRYGLLGFRVARTLP